MSVESISQSRRIPTILLCALVLSVIGIALATAGPFVTTKHHNETIRYCTNHRGPKAMWFGTFGSGAAVLCADGTTDPYYGHERLVDDRSQPPYLNRANLVATWLLWVSALTLATSLIFLVRWHWLG